MEIKYIDIKDMLQKGILLLILIIALFSIQNYFVKGLIIPFLVISTFIIALVALITEDYYKWKRKMTKIEKRRKKETR